MSLQNEIRTDRDGELRFSNFLDEIDEEYNELSLRHYYEPNGNDQAPDFALYSNVHGIILFEIKDFVIEQIEDFNVKMIKHKAYDNKTSFLEINRKLSIDYEKEFKQVFTKPNGIPVSMAYVFPNIYCEDVQIKFGLNLSQNLKMGTHLDKRVISQFIFRDDFENQEQFLLKLKNLRRFFYIESQRSKEAALSRITRYIQSPVIYKGNDGSIQTALFSNDKNENEIFVLSKKQEITLNKWINKKGYRFLKGSAGTGKTVLLIARAEYLAERIPNCKILITYYSSSLDGIFRHLMEKYPQQIKAQRIIQFCFHEINSEKGDQEKWEDYVKHSREILENDSTNPFREFYDYIFVDEGQDFTQDLGAIIELVAKGKDHKSKNVLVAYDNRQAINNARSVETIDTFKGKQAGRVRILEDSFRSPEEITIRAQRLINDKISSVRSLPDAFIHKKLPSTEDVIIQINTTIDRLLKSKKIDVERKDIAIIYPSIPYLYKRIDNDIKKINFPIQKHERKSIIRPETQSIKVLSSSYCKGLDFKVVFLIYFEYLEEQGDISINKKAKEHFYVALTRALYHVILFYTKSSPLIDLVVADENNE